MEMKMKHSLKQKIKFQQLIYINDSQEKHLYKNQEKRQSLLILI